MKSHTRFNIKYLYRLAYILGFAGVLSAAIFALSPPDVSYAGTNCWSGDGVEICLTTSDTYGDCPAGPSSDNVSTTGVPDDWSLSGSVTSFFILGPGNRQTIQVYNIDQNGNLDLDVGYPPASQWPLQSDGRTREIHVDLSIAVFNQDGERMTTLGPGNDWDVYCLDYLLPTDTPLPPTPTETPGGPTPTDTPVVPTPTETPSEPTPTVTPGEPGFPQIVDPKFAEVNDVNGNGYTDPGDEIDYSVTISNVGDVDAEGVVMSDTIDPNVSIVPGSVTTTDGTVTSGNAPGDTTITVDIGTIAPDQTVTINFTVVINDPVPDGVDDVANQAIVIGLNFPDAPSNVVVTPLGPPSDGGGPGDEDETDPGDTGGSSTGSDVLIPETGIDLTGFHNPRVQLLAQIGILFLGIGLILQGISLRHRSR